jgi:hypothetical protein
VAARHKNRAGWANARHAVELGRRAALRLHKGAVAAEDLDHEAAERGDDLGPQRAELHRAELLLPQLPVRKLATEAGSGDGWQRRDRVQAERDSSCVQVDGDLPAAGRRSNAARH